MRKMLLSIFCFVMIPSVFAFSQDNNVLWKNAADNYDKGQYDQALDNYNRLLERGYINAELYYNIGNSYFKNGDVGRAIWAYRRALIINPDFRPAKANLGYIRAFNTDQIEIGKKGFILDIWDFLTGLFSTNGFLILFCVGWWLSMSFTAYIIIRLYKSSWPYYFLIVSIIVVIFSGASAARRIHDDKLTRWGVVVAQSVDIREGPGDEFNKMEIGHEGLECIILGERENNFLIELGNGLKGWVDKKTVLEI